MKKLFFVALTAFITQVGFSQKGFTLSELLQMNQWPEKRLESHLVKIGFTPGGTFDEAGIKTTIYSDGKQQAVMKTDTPNGYTGLVWQSSAPFAIARLRKELENSGFTKSSATTVNHVAVEIYTKGKQGVTLSYSDNTEAGKRLSIYSIVIQEAAK